ncbi:hypothetical protein ILYODFUR_039123 [Ilyodon furcidens]|uniref:Uncharacterized protein n=1 Tax=Ilyodon furcidens TaxID=33524 RepID=A0ABV0T787_9TELE
MMCFLLLRHRYGDIIKALVKIPLTSDKKEERSEEIALKNIISKFSFIFLANMQTKILECINGASQLLQAKEADILKHLLFCKTPSAFGWWSLRSSLLKLSLPLLR